MDRKDLRLYVSMENTIFMHVVNSFENLVNVVLHSWLRKIMPTTFDSFIHVHVHQFED